MYSVKLFGKGKSCNIDWSTGTSRLVMTSYVLIRNDYRFRLLHNDWILGIRLLHVRIWRNDTFIFRIKFNCECYKAMN
jgi:hypothetical protein